MSLSELVDLDHRKQIPLLLVESVRKIGLTEEDDLHFTDNQADDGDLFVVLFEVLYKDGEHHLCLKNGDLPCLVNDAEVTPHHPCTLGHGDIIKIADRFIRYIGPDGSFRGQAPPKPRRSQAYELKETESIEESSEPIYEELESAEDEDDFSEELFEQLQTPQQIGNLCGSYVTREIMTYTDIKLSSTETKDLFKAFQELTLMNPELLTSFIKVFYRQQQLHSCAGIVSSIPEPVIRLLIDLLRFSLDPLSHNILWLRLLSALSEVTSNLPIFVENLVPATIMGTMAARCHDELVQQYSCEILANVSCHQPREKERAPVRHTGVELLVAAVHHHGSNVDVLHPAMRSLANLSKVMTTMVDNIEGSKYHEYHCNVTLSNCNSLIRCLRNEVLPVAESILLKFRHDPEISKESKTIIGCLSPKNDCAQQKRKIVPIVLEGSQKDLAGSILKKTRKRGRNKSVHFSVATEGGSASTSDSEHDTVYTDTEIQEGLQGPAGAVGNNALPTTSSTIDDNELDNDNVDSPNLGIVQSVDDGESKEDKENSVEDEQSERCVETNDRGEAIDYAKELKDMNITHDTIDFSVEIPSTTNGGDNIRNLADGDLSTSNTTSVESTRVLQTNDELYTQIQNGENDSATVPHQQVIISDGIAVHDVIDNDKDHSNPFNTHYEGGFSTNDNNYYDQNTGFSTFNDSYYYDYSDEEAEQQPLECSELTESMRVRKKIWGGESQENTYTRRVDVMLRQWKTLALQVSEMAARKYPSTGDVDSDGEDDKYARLMECVDLPSDSYPDITESVLRRQHGYGDDGVKIKMADPSTGSGTDGIKHNAAADTTKVDNVERIPSGSQLDEIIQTPGIDPTVPSTEDFAETASETISSVIGKNSDTRASVLELDALLEKNLELMNDTLPEQTDAVDSANVQGDDEIKTGLKDGGAKTDTIGTEFEDMYNRNLQQSATLPQKDVDDKRVEKKKKKGKLGKLFKKMKLKKQGKEKATKTVEVSRVESGDEKNDSRDNLQTIGGSLANDITNRDFVKFEITNPFVVDDETMKGDASSLVTSPSNISGQQALVDLENVATSQQDPMDRENVTSSQQAVSTDRDNVTSGQQAPVDGDNVTSSQQAPADGDNVTSSQQVPMDSGSGMNEIQESDTMSAHETELMGSIHEYVFRRQSSTRSSTGSVTLSEVSFSEDADDMVHVLALRTLIIDHIYHLWLRNEFTKAVTLVDQPIKSVVKMLPHQSPIYPYVQRYCNHEGYLLDVDPAVVIGVVGVVSQRKHKSKLAVQTLHGGEKFLNITQRPEHIIIASSCIKVLLEGPLLRKAKEDEDLAKSVLRKVTALLAYKKLPSKCRKKLKELRNLSRIFISCG